MCLLVRVDRYLRGLAIGASCANFTLTAHLREHRHSTSQNLFSVCYAHPANGPTYMHHEFGLLLPNIVKMKCEKKERMRVGDQRCKAITRFKQTMRSAEIRLSKAQRYRAQLNIDNYNIAWCHITETWPKATKPLAIISLRCQGRENNQRFDSKIIINNMLHLH